MLAYKYGGVFLLFCISVAFHHTASSYSLTPPPNQTGAPAENHCGVACHAGSVNTGLAVIKFELGDTAYIPGSTYQMSLDIKDSSGNLYGFQLTALDTLDLKAGNFSASTKTSIQNSLGRQYINHKNADTTHIWKFDWTAPSADVGPIKFFLAANVANGNGNLFGDEIYTETFSFYPVGWVVAGASSELQTVLSTLRFRVSQEHLIITWYADLGQPVDLQLVDLRGRIFWPASANLLALSEEGRLIIDLTGESSAVYLLKATAFSTTMVRKIFVP